MISSGDILVVLTAVLAVIGIITAFPVLRTLLNGKDKKKEVKPSEWRGRLPLRRVSVVKESSFRVTALYNRRQKAFIITGLIVLAVFILFIVG